MIHDMTQHEAEVIAIQAITLRYGEAAATAEANEWVRKLLTDVILVKNRIHQQELEAVHAEYRNRPNNWN